MGESRWARTLVAVAGLCLCLCGCTSAQLESHPDPAFSRPPSDARPSDEPLIAGKSHFGHRDYGLAEQSFRAAVEANPTSIDAWVGLAASYDRLHRFDLAERAYNNAIKRAGQTPEILNNLGYHYLLKGDRERARKYLLAAARQ